MATLAGNPARALSLPPLVIEALRGLLTALHGDLRTQQASVIARRIPGLIVTV